MHITVVYADTPEDNVEDYTTISWVKPGSPFGKVVEEKKL